MDDHKGSDFNPNHFTPSQNRNWSPLLVQLRLFEATVCETVRKLIEKVEAIEKGNGKDGNGIVLEGKLELFGDMMKQMDKGISEQLVGIETDLNLAQSKLTDLELTVDRISRKLDKGDEPQSGTGRPNVTEIKVAAMKSKVVEIDGIVKENRERIIFLEQKVLDENDDYFWNGHDNVDGENNFSLNQNEEEEQNQGLMGECEVMISDPFLLSGSHLSQYDGNPSISFSRWAQKFKDLLSLYTAQLTEEQKISRLRFCLAGPARAELDSMDLPPVTLDGALGHLQSRFENENTKSIARQNLAICRQYPGEKVFDFATRLSEAVRTALAGESESNIRKRLLEEFLDRLIPELQYEVKSERPTDYSRAYELAQHYELLQASRKSTSNVAMNELIEKGEAQAMGVLSSEGAGDTAVGQLLGLLPMRAIISTCAKDIERTTSITTTVILPPARQDIAVAMIVSRQTTTLDAVSVRTLRVEKKPQISKRGKDWTVPQSTIFDQFAVPFDDHSRLLTQQICYVIFPLLMCAFALSL
ncbi:hypothetical protein niasHT_035764 [Heterodera trifolii]|uniref:Paraneoplastic antigen Ma-like C-terminal domain-containing protein n=1 Tax=Heterodera trifolii TaxID=157864 RepID=A0ABD2I4Q2_9BILA